MVLGGLRPLNPPPRYAYYYTIGRGEHRNFDHLSPAIAIAADRSEIRRKSIGGPGGGGGGGRFDRAIRTSTRRGSAALQLLHRSLQRGNSVPADRNTAKIATHRCHGCSLHRTSALGCNRSKSSLSLERARSDALRLLLSLLGLCNRDKVHSRRLIVKRTVFST